MSTDPQIITDASSSSRARRNTPSTPIMPSPAPGADAIIREPECEALTGLSRSARWRMERAGRFPARIRISPGCRGPRALIWLRLIGPDASDRREHLVGTDFATVDALDHEGSSGHRKTRRLGETTFGHLASFVPVVAKLEAHTGTPIIANIAVNRSIDAITDAGRRTSSSFQRLIFNGLALIAQGRRTRPS
jgi:predicted DNA-binding transcriptional regulator AlpA